MPNETIIPVILCGGTGTRLWPLSRESFPKQYLSINSEEKNSLLQKTYKRISSLDNLSNPILVCNEDHRFIALEQMRQIDIEPLSILLEPFGKNTAPAIALAALKALEKKDDPILLVLSSDHEIEIEERFLKTIKYGIDYAKDNKLVTFGIVPTSPEVGYGYIQAEEPFKANEISGSGIIKFIEKPNIDNAKKFILDKKFTWNSGIFIFKAQTIIDEIKKYAPEVLKTCSESLKGGELDLGFQRLNNAFNNCPNISIDVAVMENTSKGIVIPLDVGWSDIGSWKAVWENSKKDKNGNTIKGNSFIENSKDCYLRSEKRLVVGIGLKNLIVIESNDVVLVVDKDETQKVKDIVEKLKDLKVPEGQRHKKVYRPWGQYISVAEESRWQVKQIEVKPGEKLSLQMHHHRSEHWIVVNGTAEVEVDDKKSVLTENQSIYIPLGSKHRLTNPGKIPLILIEVQSGAYVGEDDIVRFEDKYGR